MTRLTRLFFIALVFVAATAIAQKKNGKTREITAADVVGTWWLKHDLGSMDGYQLEANGKLQIVNHYVWFGKTWELKKDTMTWVMYADEQVPETARYIISEFSHDSFVLTPLTANAGEKKLFLHQHTGKHKADSLTGRWTGSKGSFMDIIPQRNGYKIVVMKEGGKEGDEYEGIADGDRFKITSKAGEEFITVGTSREKRRFLVMKTAGEFYRE